MTKLAQEEALTVNGVTEPAASGTVAAANQSVRKAILRAADRCFRQLGPRRATLDDVAALAGVSRRTIYNYFDGKNGLVAEIIALEAERAGQQAMRRLDLELGSAELVAEAELLLVECSLKSPYHRIFSRPEAMSLAVEVFGHSERFADVQRRYWYPIFDIVAARGDLRPDFDRAEAVEWLNRVNLMLTGPASLAGDRDTLRRLVRRYVAPGFVRG